MRKTIFIFSTFAAAAVLTGHALPQSGITSGSFQDVPVTAIPLPAPPPAPPQINIITTPTLPNGGVMTGSSSGGLPIIEPLLWHNDINLAISTMDRGDTICRTLDGPPYFIGRAKLEGRAFICIYARSNKEERSKKADFLTVNMQSAKTFASRQELISKRHSVAKWIPSRGAYVPNGALRSWPNQGLAVCRANVGGYLHAGWVGSNGCNVAVNNAGRAVAEYDVIAFNQFYSPPPPVPTTTTQLPQTGPFRMDQMWNVDSPK